MENKLFCSHCGKEAAPEATVCLSCGCEIKKGNKFCTHCGSQVQPEQAICVKCGCSLKQTKEGKNRLAAGLLAIFLGWLGVHKFYMGQTGLGVVYLLCGTVGWILILPPCIIGLISLIEGIIYLCMSDEEFDAKYNK